MVWYAYFVMPRQMQKRLKGSLKAFSKAVELRCPSHLGGTESVVRRSFAVGRILGLGSRRLSDLGMAAELRDIGLCAVPYAILNRTDEMESWTPQDRQTYERHPEYSAAMLEFAPSLGRLAPIVRTHHVCFDGSMGSLHPSGAELPLESRILKVVTDYGWLESTRGSAFANATLKQLSGRDFDPIVVEAMLAVLTSEGAHDYRRVAVRA